MLNALKSDISQLGNYAPDDLYFMRQAFQRACDENPLIAVSQLSRDSLAKAIVDSFENGISEGELVKLALSSDSWNI